MTHTTGARLGFIGTGTIAEAIVDGLSATGEDPILVSPRNAGIAARLSTRFAHVEVARNNQAVLDGSDTIILAVRPQVADAILAPLRFRREHRVISLMAAVSLDQLHRWTAPADRVVRAVPLPSVARRAGPTAMFPPDAEARRLFQRLGTAIELADESEFEVFTAATAAMASYFAFAHSIADWMERSGVEAARARGFVAQMLKGLSETAVAAPQSSFSALAEEHQTRGGINEQLFRRLTRNGRIPGLDLALDEIADRLRET